MLEEKESTIEFEHPRRVLRRSKTLVEDTSPSNGEMLAEDIPPSRAEVLLEDMSTSKSEALARETFRPVSFSNVDTPLPVSLPSITDPLIAPQKQTRVTRSKKSGSDDAKAY